MTTTTIAITLAIITGLAALAAALLLRPATASAHCDTMDGPAVKDGRAALEDGNLNIALKWVHADGTEELTRIFDQARAARALGEAARVVADQWFLENFVRIHRAGEGAPYTGIQPSGTAIDPRVAAADEAIEVGNLAPLQALVPAELHDELAERFAEVLARKDFDVDDVEAGRDYIEAYVKFFHLAEGHGHEHHHEHHAH
ncbi:DUF6448 family protein [Propionibacteriaceae bacterium G1746]